MVKLIKNSFILGKARVRVTGLSLESLLNMAAENGIVLENVIRTEYACIEADVLRSDLKKLYRLIPEQSYKTALIGRKGVSFTVSANIRRIALFLGMILAFSALIAASQRTWEIRVTGSSRPEQIEQMLREYGLLDWHSAVAGRIGEAEKMLTSGQEDVLWSSISVKGAVVDVYIKEDKSLKPQEPLSGNIVASKDCIIKNLIVTQGTAQVKNGQLVSKGQKLIDGSVQFGENIYSVTPQGRALASVWYYDSAEILLEETVAQPTGRTKTVRNLAIFGMNVSLGGQNEFEQFTAEKRLVNCAGLPIVIEETVYIETENIIVPVDKNAAVAQAEKELLDGLQLQLPEDAKIAETKTTVEEENGVIRVFVYIETIEDVAVRE